MRRCGMGGGGCRGTADPREVIGSAAVVDSSSPPRGSSGSSPEVGEGAAGQPAEPRHRRQRPSVRWARARSESGGCRRTQARSLARGPPSAPSAASIARSRRSRRSGLVPLGRIDRSARSAGAAAAPDSDERSESPSSSASRGGVGSASRIAAASIIQRSRSGGLQHQFLAASRASMLPSEGRASPLPPRGAEFRGAAKRSRDASRMTQERRWDRIASPTASEPATSSRIERVDGSTPGTSTSIERIGSRRPAKVIPWSEAARSPSAIAWRPRSSQVRAILSAAPAASSERYHARRCHPRLRAEVASPAKAVPRRATASEASSWLAGSSSSKSQRDRQSSHAAAARCSSGSRQASSRRRCIGVGRGPAQDLVMASDPRREPSAAAPIPRGGSGSAPRGPPRRGTPRFRAA